MVTVRIANAYSDGHQSENDIELDAPTGDIDTWFDEVVFPFTGDGHGANEDLGSCYIATIVKSPEKPDLLGKHYEWID